MSTAKNPQEFLNLLPYRLNFYDNKLQLVYSNKQSDGSFFPESDEQELPIWIWEALQAESDKTLHLPLASSAFDRALIQTYQALYDSKGNFHGICSYIQDLNPMLNTYLKETGQALVGWSDTTSGPSMKSARSKEE